MIAHLFKNTINKTRQTRVLNTIFILAGGALLLVLFLHFGRAYSPVVAPSSFTKVSVGTTPLWVTIADSESEREQGLSGTASLGANEGKLFVFEEPGSYGFWMKDMSYSLDIIWIDKDLRVIGVEKDLRPDSYPAAVYPPSDALYVLEVNAGFSTAHNLVPNQLLAITPELVF